MKVSAVKKNNRKRAFEIESEGGRFSFPYAVCDTVPSPEDPIVELFIDPEVGYDGFTYRLASGAEDTILMDYVLSYVRDPAYVHKTLLFNLTSEALDCLKRSRLSRREVIRQLGTSPAQLYRLLDTTNYRKSVDQMLRLLQVLGCEVDFVVTPRTREN